MLCVCKRFCSGPGKLYMAPEQGGPIALCTAQRGAQQRMSCSLPARSPPAILQLCCNIYLDTFSCGSDSIQL